DRERASPDRAENWAGVIPAGEQNEPSRFASEHLSDPAGSVAIAGPIPVVIECLDLIAPDPSEARRGGGHLWRVQERNVDIERDTGGASVHGSGERGLDPEAIDGFRHLGRESFTGAEARACGRGPSAGLGLACPILAETCRARR